MKFVFVFNATLHQTFHFLQRLLLFCGTPTSSAPHLRLIYAYDREALAFAFPLSSVSMAFIPPWAANALRGPHTMEAQANGTRVPRGRTKRRTGSGP